MGDSMPTVPYADVPRPDPPADDASPQDWTAFQLALQAPACRVLGSELYADLLVAAAEDVRADGPAWAVLASHATRDIDAALALRFMAAIHRLVLTRQAPALATFFPSVGGSADRRNAWPALRDALEQHRELLVQWVGLPCQTNEVGRCAALVAGFLTAASRSGRPLQMLEIGASGGLNLLWDRYFYEDTATGRSWGDPQSPVHLRGQWDVPRELLAIRPEVTSRHGCDPRPVDILTAEGRLRLTASVWGDQRERFTRLRGALQLATETPAHVDAATAIDWLPARLAEPAVGEATVVYHSVVMQYLDPAERRSVVEAIHTAGARATETSPLFWLRMEPEQPLRAMSVRMTQWPGGEEKLLATAGAHGNPVRWREAP